MKKDPLVSERDILSGLVEDKSTSLFLGRYSIAEVAAVLGRRNFFREAKKRNLWPLVFNLDSSGHPVQRYQIFLEEEKPEKLIVDLKIREGRLRPRDQFHLPASFYTYEFLILEWLTLQNPLLKFSPKRPPLPGQEHPGLGLGKKVVDLFVYLARLTQKDGLLVFPAYFHNALLFTRYFQFLNPQKQGEVLAVRKSLSDIPFKHLAWMAYLNCLREDDGRIYEWMAEEQVFPLNRSLKEYFESRAYKQKVKKVLNSRRFAIDWACYEKKVDELIAAKA
ncbi:MAG: hypothetical protein QHH14_13150 [Clostridiales bacterium]|nr:hypothetical protein [Clostridiales bacterium]